MNPALQTPAVEAEYEQFGGTRRVVRYYHPGRREWIVRELYDPGRRERRPQATPSTHVVRREGQ